MSKNQLPGEWRKKFSNEYIDRLTEIFLNINQDKLSKAGNEERRMILLKSLSRLNSLAAFASPLGFPEGIPTPRAIITMTGYYGPNIPTPIPLIYSYNDASSFFDSSDGVRFYFGLDDHDNLIIFLCACSGFNDWGSADAPDTTAKCVYNGQEVTSSTQPNIKDLKKMVNRYKASQSFQTYISKAVYLNHADLHEYVDGVVNESPFTVQIFFGIVPDGYHLPQVGQLTVVLAWGDSNGRPIESSRTVTDDLGNVSPVVYDDNGTLYPPGTNNVDLNSSNSIFYP